MARRYRSFICDSSRWEGFELRPGDVIVTTPPKCGTTWMQTCCLLLVHGHPLPASLSTLSPWLDQTLLSVAEVHARLEAQAHRRVIKTHTPMDGIPWDERVTYIGVGRDPRDAMLSMVNHMENLDVEAAVQAKVAAGLPVEVPKRPPDAATRTPDDAVRAGIDDPAPPEDFRQSLRFVVHHLQQLWDRRGEPNVALFHYGEMRRDPAGQLRRLAGVLGIDVDDAKVAQLVEASSFDAMRDNAATLAPSTDVKLWRDATRFFAEGRLGGWRNVVSPATLDHYEARLAELAPDPEFRAWLHTGSPARTATNSRQ